MTTLRRLALLLALVALVGSLPAAAEVFEVKLKNGNSFTTRYRPRIAGWDESKVVLVTEVGNVISLPKDEIAEVIADTEVRGFGTVINTTTIALGWAPNDALTPEQQAAAAGDPRAQLLRYLEAQQQARPNYTVDQFVDAEDAGAGGLPAWDFSYGGGAQGFLVPGAPRVQPPAAPRVGAGAEEGGQ